jgi:hypothetical protein
MSNVQDYTVGYGRPPLASRFSRGRSGNPAGRPKGSRNVSSVIAAALSERVVVTQNGRRRSITKLEAACTQMANKAASGDRQAAKLIIDLLHQAEARDEARAGGASVGADQRRETDAAILAAVRESALNITPEVHDHEPA